MQPDAQEGDGMETDWLAADCGSRNTVFEENRCTSHVRNVQETEC